MCIYFTNQENLTYKNGEHIIPAGIGGKQKLPKNYVSDQFNNFISKNEQKFLRNSIISVPRQILGPGKRGSLISKKQTKSEISVFTQINDDTLFSLGYIKQGKAFEIPHIVLNFITGETQLSLPKDNFEQELLEFKKSISDGDFKVKLIKFPALDTNTFLFGIKSEIEENYNCFVASQDGTKNPFNQKILNSALEVTSAITRSASVSSSKIKAHQKAKIDINYYRCCAKIAFNYIAYLKGNEFVNQQKFDAVRNLIVQGINDELVQISPTFPKNFANIFPADSHQILITKIDDNLVANICLYNHFNQGVLLCENFNDEFDIQGFICDWRNEKEYDFIEYLVIKKDSL